MKLPRLIDDWHRAWSFLSVQAAALLAVLSAIQADMLPFIQPIVPPKYWPVVTAAFGVAITVLRILRQFAPATAASTGEKP